MYADSIMSDGMENERISNNNVSNTWMNIGSDVATVNSSHQQTFTGAAVDDFEDWDGGWYQQSTKPDQKYMLSEACSKKDIVSMAADFQEMVSTLREVNKPASNTAMQTSGSKLGGPPLLSDYNDDDWSYGGVSSAITPFQLAPAAKYDDDDDPDMFADDDQWEFSQSLSQKAASKPEAWFIDTKQQKEQQEKRNRVQAAVTPSWINKTPPEVTDPDQDPGQLRATRGPIEVLCYASVQLRSYLSSVMKAHFPS